MFIISRHIYLIVHEYWGDCAFPRSSLEMSLLIGLVVSGLLLLLCGAYILLIFLSALPTITWGIWSRSLIYHDSPGRRQAIATLNDGVYLSQ
jgi:hypothetical protein